MYPNSQEFESTRLNETLTAFSDDGKMMVKYGRALRKGEYRVKVYHLDLDKPNEAPFLLCETGELESLARFMKAGRNFFRP